MKSVSKARATTNILTEECRLVEARKICTGGLQVSRSLETVTDHYGLAEVHGANQVKLLQARPAPPPIGAETYVGSFARVVLDSETQKGRSTVITEDNWKVMGSNSFLSDVHREKWQKQQHREFAQQRGEMAQPGILMREGKGTLSWPNGASYSGCFKAGKFEGEGTLTRPDVSDSHFACNASVSLTYSIMLPHNYRRQCCGVIN